MSTRTAVSLAALAVVVIMGAGVAALALTDDDGPDPDVADDPTAATTTAPTPGGRIACPGGAEPQQSVFDHSGYPSFTAMLQGEADFRGAYVVDRATKRLLYLRDDGSVHTEVTWMGGARDDEVSRNDWFPSSEAACADAESWAGVPLDVVAPDQPLTLEVGHCWIEPARFEGRRWDVVEEDQFGWGGGQPVDFTGSGEAWRAGDVVTYVDDSGDWLTLVPAGDPWALDRGICD